MLADKEPHMGDCKVVAQSASREKTYIRVKLRFLVINHGKITKEQLVKATALMLQEVQQLEDGEYKVFPVANLFVDCCDRALVIPQSTIGGSMASTGRVAHMYTKH